MSVNKVILVGHLGADPEVSFLPSGEPVANFRIATTKRWKDKTSGENREQTEWHRLTVFGKRAEFVSEFLKKGRQVYVEGELRTRKYTDKDNVERYATEIIAHEVQMLGKRDDAPAA